MNLPNYKKWAEFITVLFVVLSGFCMTAFYKINNFFTFPNLDELLWQMRSRVFWNKMMQFDFSGLIHSAQPGITVYWFTGFMMKFIDFDFNYVNVLIAEKVSEGLTFNDVMNVNDQEVFQIYERVSFLFNLPLFFLTAVFFISFYYLLRKIGFNMIVSLFSLYFLATNIFLTYWTTPSDKMLDIFMTLSFLTFLVYMNQRPKKKYLILSAIFGAWAALSKLTGLFVIPFYFFAYIFYVWPLDRTKLKAIFKDAFLWVIVFILVCILFLPTIITNPGEVYNLFFNTTRVYETSYGIGSYSNRVSDYLLTLFTIFGSSMSPGIFIFLAIFVAMFFKKKYRAVLDFSPKKHNLAIMAYIIFFILMVTVLSINHDVRFMAPSFIMLNVIAAAAFYNIMEIIRKKMKFGGGYFYIVALIVLIFAQFSTIFTGGLLLGEAIKKFIKT